MKRRMIVALAALVVLATVLCTPPKAEATKRFAVVGIENGTDVTIRVWYRWGKGQEKLDKIAPGQRKWYSWKYDRPNEDRSPPFHVRFDSDLSPGQFVTNYDLKKNAAPDQTWDFAKKYIFKYDRSRRFIELYKK
jgi:hypothetical protein